MTSLDEHLEMRLQEWAKWFRDSNNVTELGFPQETILYRLWRDGILVSAKYTSHGVLPCNSRAEEIDKWVNQLYKQNQKQGHVIRVRYFSPRKLPIEVLAKRIKMSTRTFEDNLRMAKNYLRGCICVSRDFVV